MLIKLDFQYNKSSIHCLLYGYCNQVDSNMSAKNELNVKLTQKFHFLWDVQGEY